VFDLEEVPFSRFGSYFSFSINDWAALGKALYLRVNCGKSPEVFKIDPVRDGELLKYEIEASPHLLTLRPEGGGKIEFVVAGDDTVRVRGEGVSLRLEMPKGRWVHTYEQPNGVWAFNMSPHAIQIALEPLEGELSMDAPWEQGKGFCFESSSMVATLTPDSNGVFEAAIDDFLTAWIRPDRPAFDDCRAEVEQEYAVWQKGLPEVADEYTQARDLAAYVNWSAVVNPAGYIKRPTMYMSKIGMCNVYNWDNVFNAMAHCNHQPELAWDQLLVMADHQDEHGKSPSSMNRSEIRYTVTNSPIHGWGLRYMWDNNPDMMTPERMSEAYDYLSRWTGWITNHRTWPGDCLPYHHHGFDGGWDNSTIFDQGVPVITPDQPAYLILLMEALADLADAMGRSGEAASWKERANTMLTALLEDLWKEDHFVGMLRPSGKTVECESLLICMPMVLGKRLPEEVQKHLVARIKDHLTEHGLATEKLDSPNYIEGGYWRGPIWAPSTMLITSGLDDIGEHELARTIKRAFCEMCKKHGFYENFDPVTGEGYYDPAYTWTSSVFMMFANQLHLTETE
jgi:putative isomerase